MLKRATNCALGSIIGDAFGGRYEFNNKKFHVDRETFKEHVPILGEGIWNLVPGQVTDDTEMALALCNSIIKNNNTVNSDNIAFEYHNWYLSKPFDIGRATENAIKHDKAIHMINSAKAYDTNMITKYNTPNLSNGMLMRIWPIAVHSASITHQFSDRDLAEFVHKTVSKDVILTHSSDEALWYCVAYVMLLTTAIQDGSINRGISIIQAHYHKYHNIGDWYTVLLNGMNPAAKLCHDPTDRPGDVRIAFQLAVRKAIFVMRKEMTYSEAIISTVHLGGDTDTNAAIVGALCGAVSELPTDWVSTVKQCKCERYEKYPIAKYIATIETVIATMMKN